MIKCVLFDMDGTLSNTLDDLKVALNYTLSKLNLPLRSSSEVLSFVGNGIDALVMRGLPDNAKDRFQEALPIFKDYYKDHLTDYTRPYDGVNETIDALIAKGIKMGIVSNKLQAPLEEIVRSFWGNKINAVCGITDYYDPKPSPDMVRVCLDRLGCALDEAIYVGDSLVDVQTAANAKARFIACSWGFCTREKLIAAGATEVIDHPLEVLEYIK
ncbi:MAG: HAD-IA family hydrolase [Clostridia bacterium]|nr:HAD-IA family hydrolase [Clostridia bacterium]